MNTNWQNSLTTLGATISGDPTEVQHFGDAAAELAAAATGTILAPLNHLGLLELQGEDSKSFLHAQLTSDINHLTAEAAQHSAWCTPKGRMLASFIVSRCNDAYRLIVAKDLAAPVAKRLQMYILRAKAKTTDLSDTHVLLGLSGPQAASALAAAGLAIPGETLTTATGEGTQVIYLDQNRYIISATAEAAPALWAKLAAHARPVGLPVWRWLDVQAAFPLITAATKEEFVPQMADFEQIGGVSFKKGCYPGQEIVARTQYLGKVKRHLYRVHSLVTLAAGDELHSPDHPDQATGKIVSAAPAPEGGYAALAVIQANFADSVHLGAVDGPAVQTAAVNASQ